jgi:hypothetical protein
LVESFIGGAGMGGITGTVMGPQATTSEKYDRTVDKLKKAGATDEEIDELGRSMVDDIESKADKMISDDERDFLERIAADRAEDPGFPDEINADPENVTGETSPPIDPERKDIFDDEKVAEETERAVTGEDVSDVTDPKLKKTAERDRESLNRLNDDTIYKEIEADVLDSETETTFEDVEAILSTPQQKKLQAKLDAVEKQNATDLEAETMVESELAKKAEEDGADKAIAKAEATFKEHRAEADEHLKGETLNGMMLETDTLDGKDTADAGEVLRESNKLEDIMTEIKGCLGGK